MAEMYGDDRHQLNQMLGIPIDMLEIPADVVKLYSRAQRAQHRSGQPGGLDRSVLMMICIACDALPQIPEPRTMKYGNVPEGTKMWFRVDRFHVEPCVLLRVLDDVTHTYLVRVLGSDRPVAENRLLAEHPGEPAPTTPVQAAPEELVEDDDDADDSDVVMATDKSLRDEFPRGQRVEVCVPGSDDYFGKILGHGSGKLAGKFQVVPEDRSKKYCWVLAEHCYAVEVAALVE